MKMLGKPKMLKEVNSSMIEQLIYQNGPISKPNIAKITKLSIPTVTSIVDDLEKRQRICSAGHTTDGVGRKALLYQINKDSGCIIVLYYFGGKYLCRLADIVGNILYEETFPLDIASAESAMSSTVQAIDAMFCHAPSEVIAIGVGMPGVVMHDGKLFGIPKIKVWEGFDLKAMLSERYAACIYMENDINLSAVGYYLTNLSNKLDNIVYIYAGDGMGSGIIINKKLFKGSTNFSGELGFMAPLTGEKPQYDYTLEGGYFEKKINLCINCSSNNKENDTKEALINFFTAIAANYTAIINPAAIVFGGEAFDEHFIDAIRQRLGYYAPKCSIPQVIYDSSDKIGIHGLVLACIGEINMEVQLVQNGGV